MQGAVWTRALWAVVLVCGVAAVPARAQTVEPAQPAPTPAGPTTPQVTPSGPADPSQPAMPSAPNPNATIQADVSTAKAPPPAAPPAFNLPLPKIGFTAMWYQYVGEGTFAVNQYVRNPMYSWWVSLRPRVKLPFGFGAQLRQDMEIEFTRSELSTYVRQPLLSDTRMGISYSGFRLPEVGVGVMLYGGARLPLSLESRFRRQLGSVEMVVGVDWSKWGFIASIASFGVAHARQPGKPTITEGGWLNGWWGNGNDSQGYQDRNGSYMPTQKCVARASEIASGGCPVPGALNGSIASVITFGTLGYDLSALTEIPVSFSATLATIHAFSSYVGPNDQFTPDNGRVGITRTDATWGLLQVSWQATDWLSIDLGSSSFQPLMSRDNAYVRLPFWNIPYWDWRNMGRYSGAANYSSFSLGLTMAI